MARDGKTDKRQVQKYASIEEVRASVRDEERFKSLTPLQQATHLLMEKICALNMGVMDALLGCDLEDGLRLVAQDLKVHIDRFLTALGEEHERRPKRPESPRGTPW
jgi:hypothetical protein